MGTKKSNLDLVNECDNFPYFHDGPHRYLEAIAGFYHLKTSEDPSAPTLGFITAPVAEVLRGIPHWAIDDDAATILVAPGASQESRSEIVAQTCQAMRMTGHFKLLEGWRDELYPVYGRERELLFDVERSASALFGVVTYGVHMMAFVREQTEDKKEEVKVWVPRRAKTKSTYAGMMDNTVAGGIATGENQFECLVRECQEEASLPEDVVRRRARPVGTVTYFHTRDEKAGGETDLLQPECQYVYDLDLTNENISSLKPGDGEAEDFRLLTIDEVREALAAGEFKPNCALCMLDFMVRHGLLTAENDKDYIEIVARLHRKLEFPML